MKLSDISELNMCGDFNKARIAKSFEVMIAMPVDEIDKPAARERE